MGTTSGNIPNLDKTKNRQEATPAPQAGTAQAAPQTAAARKPIDKLKLAFTGHLHKKALRRVHVSQYLGTTVKSTTVHDFLQEGTIMKAYEPKVDNAGELSITLDVQYQPSQTLRLTASSQNVEPIIDMLKGKVDPETQVPYEEIKINAAMNEMRANSRGYNVVELELVAPDKSHKVVIAPAADVQLNTRGDASADAQSAFM